MAYNKNIEDLLNKYWSTESDDHEEQLLKEHFSEAESNDPDSQYFRFLKSEAQIKAPRDFSAQVTDLVAESKPKTISLAMRKWMRVAAALIFVILAAFAIRQQTITPSESYAFEDTFETPEEAYAEARQALLMVSQKMQKTQSIAAVNIAKAEQYTNILK